MLRAMYSGISGLRNFQTKLDVVGNNIANVNTPGFKKSRVIFQDILSQTIQGATAPATDPVTGGINPRQIGLGMTVGAIDTLHTQGSPMTTNYELDLRIDGNAYFVVSPDPSTDEFYFTRAGNFAIDAEGNLVTSNGYFVLDKDGNKINVDSGDPDIQIASISIGQDGSVRVKYDDGSEIDPLPEIGTAIFTNPGGLEKVGNSLFQWTPNASTSFTRNEINSPTESGVKIISGQLEMSNVDLAEEFTEMIIAQRGFQANSRIITTSDEILQELVNLKR
ncbi:flagellar basal body rod protein FlgG [Bacillaceae bacterium]